MITLQPVRADTLPENTNYKDDGCDLAPSCLACPLPVCKYDDPGWMRRAARHGRDREVVRLRTEEGRSADELAELFRVSARTIHRILQSERRGGLNPHDAIPVSPAERLGSLSYFKLHSPLPPMRSFNVAGGPDQSRIFDRPAVAARDAREEPVLKAASGF